MTTIDDPAWEKFKRDLMTEDQLYAVMERAGIHEFDGGMTRAEAERRTMEDYEKDQLSD